VSSLFGYRSLSVVIIRLSFFKCRHYSAIVRPMTWALISATKVITSD